MPKTKPSHKFWLKIRERAGRASRHIRQERKFYAWMGLLAIVFLAGALGFIQVWSKGLVVTNLSNQVPWGLWIIMDLSFVALGAGSFVTAGLLFIFGRKEFEPLARAAILVGLAADTGTTLVLLADLGRPDRFYHPLIYWNPRSLLWVITWCVILYVTVLAFEMAPVLAESRLTSRWPGVRAWGQRFHHNFGPLVAIVGVGISLVHQPAIGAAYSIVKGNPMWSSGTMPVLFLATAMFAGPSLLIGVVAATAWAMDKELVPQAVLQQLARVVGIGITAYIILRVWDLLANQYFTYSPLLMQQWKLLSTQTPYSLGVSLGEFVIGAVIPALIYLNPRANRRSGNLIFAALCTTIGLLLYRWDTTLSGVTASLSYSPSRPGVTLDPYFPSMAEWMVSIGVVAFAGMIYTLGVRLLPIFPGTRGHKSLGGSSALVDTQTNGGGFTLKDTGSRPTAS